MNDYDHGPHIRTCPLCEAMCGIEVAVEGDRVVGITPDRRDVWSRGYICPKGACLGDLHHDPDRLRAPLIREGDRWHEVGWPEAYGEVERRLHAVIEAYGISAVATYIGNPTAHNFSLSRYAGAFIAMSTITQVYSAGTVDQWPKNVVGALMYGGMWTIPVPDLDRTDYLMMLGANPSASQGSLCAAADVPGRIAAIRKRGGKVVVIDPRRTASAAEADRWIPIRPGTDAALLMAIVHVLFAENLVNLSHLGPITRGVDILADLCGDFTPAAVARTCNVPVAAIVQLAHELAAAPSATVYGRIGTCTQEFGTLASWLVEVLNIITGNLDRPGGSMLSNPIAWSLTSLTPPDFADGFTFGRWRSRVRGAPEVLGQYPVSCLAEEMKTPGDGQIRALITVAGNPVLSAPGGASLDSVLPHLDCMVSVDNYLNETTRYAKVILPGLSPLEQPHYDEMIWSWALRNAGKYSPPLFPPGPGRHAEWEILLTLAGITGGMKAREIDIGQLDDLYFGGIVDMVTRDTRSRIAGRSVEEIIGLSLGRGPERLLDFAIRTGPYGDAYGVDKSGLTLRAMRQYTHGIDMGPLEPCITERLRTRSGKIELAPAYIAADLGRLRRRLDRHDAELVLISRRHLRSNNSWMHNLEKLVRGRNRCTLLVHPDDAGRLRLTDGEQARITSTAGSIQAQVEVTDTMTPGVVCLPHGWGHDKPVVRLSVAIRYPGVNSNQLAPRDLIDAPSGNAVVNGIPVEVEPVTSGQPD